MHNCRLWKLEGDDTFSDVRDSLDARNMPTPIAGRLLEPHQLVADINVADGEGLVLEWKVALEKSSTCPWAYEPAVNAKRKKIQKESRLPEELKAL
jgi:ubiquitin C-terminal hydrolase